MNADTAKFQEEILTRTMDFSEKLIKTLVKLPRNSANDILVRQTIRSGTSIGANYREACEAESGKDFVHKLGVSKKECRESIYWLELLVRINPKFSKTLHGLLSETEEFTKIFSVVIKKFK